MHGRKLSPYPPDMEFFPSSVCVCENFSSKGGANFLENFGFKQRKGGKRIWWFPPNNVFFFCGRAPPLRIITEFEILSKTEKSQNLKIFSGLAKGKKPGAKP